MADRTKIGPRVDSALWDRFRDHVQEKKGQTRGVLGDELETAIKEYLRDDATPAERRIEKRLERIETAVGAAATDGGTTHADADEYTHTPSRLDTDGKPPANAATDKKVAYLADYVRDEYGRRGTLVELPRSKIIEAVKAEYSFRSDTAKRYVDRLIDHFGMVEHPTADAIVVTPERREEILEQRREKARDELEGEA